MKRQEAPPGADGSLLSRPGSGFDSTIEIPARDDGLGAWSQEYLRLPANKRLGVCCSGGGIRSASYCLGGLQILAEARVLEATEFLSAVSGGAYTAVARTAAVAATFEDFDVDQSPGSPVRLPDPAAQAPESFATLAPFAPNSPEERNLRDDSSYLARGLNGKAWLGVNLIYGAVRHLLPFVAGLFLLASVFGLAFHKWIGPSLHPGKAFDWKLVRWNLLIAAGIAVLGALFLTVRQLVASSRRPSGAAMAALQGLSMLMLRSAIAVSVLLAGLPASLRLLSLRHQFLTAGIPTVGGASLFSGAYVYLSKRGQVKRLVKYLRLLLPVAGLIVVGIPFIGFTYWVAQQGFHLRETGGQETWPLYAMFAAVTVFVGFSFLDEVTPSMHLFYREKLAKALIGMRVHQGNKLYWREPPWHIPLSFSNVQDHAASGAKLPKLVVCASVSASDESVPLGRNAGPFTFEHNYSGSPLTGYVPTKDLEAAAGEEVVTMPAMMAIAGAALSPTMGKMTRPALRLLMALFNVRLGVWLPNPAVRFHPLSAQRRRVINDALPVSPAGVGRDARLRRPGMLYILREALGLNSLRQRYVYVTDGGHYENLGLVELLRRGCGQIVCFDAAGDDLTHFHTISEAIALARSDLGVEIDIDLEPLRPVNGVSPSDHACGSIRYPDGAATTGVLVFAKAAMAEDAPQDAKAYQEVDPRFPHHSTADQFFNERTFEAYRGLGIHAARGCVVMLNEYREKHGYEQFYLDPVPPPPCTREVP